MTAWLDELNPSQRQAVTFGDGPLLVVAGAGTGKTKTLACRVAWLIARGVAPERLLLLTFTRRAAAEMIRRAEHYVGQGGARRVWGGTFHSVANRLLRHHASAVGLTPDFSVMDEGDAADLMNLVRTDLGAPRGDKRFPRKETLVSIYSRMVNARIKLGAALKRFFPWCADHQDAIRAIFEQYTQRKREQNLVDYDDLLVFWEALGRSPAGASISERFEHVLVDEYQDTNPLQADLLVSLRGVRRNLCVVGDDAQSIYSFRAATVRNILDFPRQFPDAQVVTLEQNYRSTQAILDASNAVMAGVRERYTKNLWTSRQGGQRPLLVVCEDETQQCEAVCRRILEHFEAGLPLHKQAVLIRAGWHSDMLEVELTRRRIPYHKYGGLRFLEAAHVKDLLAFLRVLENPHDELSWFRVLLLLDGIGPRTARRILDALGVRRGRSPTTELAVSPLQRLFHAPSGSLPAGDQIADLRAVWAECAGFDVESGTADAETGPPLASQIERVRLFYEPIFERIYDNAAVRLRDLEQIERIAAGYESRRAFITDLTLDPPQSTSDLAGQPYLEEDFLVVSTIHSAKGGEWNAVHVLHAADGMIPSDMALSDEAGLDEERRLFYVALTRAKDHLYVYAPLRYYHRRYATGDQHSYAQLTRFISPEVRRLFDQTLPADPDTLALPTPVDPRSDLARYWADE